MTSYKAYTNFFASTEYILSQPSTSYHFLDMSLENDEERNAMTGLLYLYGQMPFIQHHENYSPDRELEFFNQIKDTLTYIFLNHKISLEYLDSMECFLNQQTSQIGRDAFTTPPACKLNPEQIIKKITDISQDALKKFPEYNEGCDNHTLEELLILTTSFAKQVSEANTNTKIEFDVSQVRKLFSSMFLINRYGIDLSSLFFIIEFLISHASNKQLIMQTCLNTFQSVRTAIKRGELSASNIGYLPFISYLEIAELLIYLNQYLTPEENLYDLIKSTTFKIPHKQELQMVSAAICGNKVDDLSSLWYTIQPRKLEFIVELIKISAKQVTADVNPELLYLPPIFQLQMQEKGQIFSQKFIKFLKTYENINKQTEAFQQRPLLSFLLNHSNNINQLLEIMGEEGITYMNKQFAKTVLSLERKIKNLYPLHPSLMGTLKNYFDKHKNEANVNDVFYQCLQLIGFATETFISVNTIIATLNENLSPNDLRLWLIKKVLAEIKINETQLIEVCNRIPIEKLTKIIMAEHKLKGSNYKNIFSKLVTIDLLNENVDNFLHDSQQNDPLGKKLSLHNEGIRNKLLIKNISPPTALNYSKVYNFIISTHDLTANHHANQISLMIQTYLLELSKQVTQIKTENIFDAKVKSQLSTLKNNFSTIEQSIKDKTNHKDIAKILSRSINRDLLNKIIKNINALTDEKATFHKVNKAKIVELAIEINKQLNIFNTLQIQENAQYFTVEQWSKNKVDTFFLGDEVGCCLATNGTQFEAMVQRRIDDAMLFHVAIDKKTGKPAALIWLFLAETLDGKVVLVSNFIEANARYGSNPDKSLGLLHGLLKFTEMYLKDNPNIKEFYMNEMNYGWFEEKLAHYPLVTISDLDKLGGPYRLNEEDTRPTKENYYLVSLYQPSFHHFDAKILDQHKPSCFYSLKDLFKSFIKEQMQENISLKHLPVLVFQHYETIAQAFYSKATDEKFLSLISECVHELQPSLEIKNKAIIKKPTTHTFFKPLMHRLQEKILAFSPDQLLRLV